jgi:hypothetical protein
MNWKAAGMTGTALLTIALSGAGAVAGANKFSGNISLGVGQTFQDDDYGPIFDESFASLSGETKHITQSLSTRGKTIEGIDVNGTGTITVTDSGAIGVEKDSVKGADILVPVVSFSETHYFLRKDLTRALRTTWESMFAYTNNSLFRDYAVGEVLFSGVQTTVKGGPDGTVPVTFQFQRRANVKDENVGGIVLDIEGWELVDMRYKPQLNTTSKRTEATPSKVLLHKVYKAGNFGDLGISTT